MSYLLRLVVPDRPGILGAVATGPLAVVTGGVTTIVGTTGVIGLGLIYALVAAALVAAPASAASIRVSSPAARARSRNQARAALCAGEKAVRARPRAGSQPISPSAARSVRSRSASTRSAAVASIVPVTSPSRRSSPR